MRLPRWTYSLCLLTGLSTPALADPPAAVGPAAPAEVAPTPTPAPPMTAAERLKELAGLIRVYGFLKPTVNLASGAVASFSQVNATAPTAAANPAYASLPTHARLSFQMAQSRLGAWLNEAGVVRGHVEVDFIDFTKSTPTVAALPRLRIAAAEWHPTESFTLLAGQDWDLIQPVNPHGLNYVGALFEAGNVGYMRQQVRGLYKVGDLELGAVIGMQGPNNTAKDGALELSTMPVFEARVQYNLGAMGKVGVSGLATSLLFKQGTADEVHTFAGVAGAYGDLNFGTGFNLRFEGYWAKNAANLNTLGLSQGRAGTGATTVDVSEAGAFVSAKGQLAGPVSLYGMFGGAGVLNPTDVAASYGYTGTIDPANPPALGSGALTSTGPGIHWNLAGRLGVEWKVLSNLSFNLEGFWYRTSFALAAIDAGRSSTVSHSLGGEVGALFTF